MKNLKIVICSLIFLTISSISICQDTTEYFNYGNGEKFAELKLHANNTFSETMIDWHGGYGKKTTGTYSWNKQILTLNYGDSEQENFFFDSTNLYLIHEFSYIKESSISSTNFVELTLDSGLTKHSQPIRQTWPSWSKGENKNFDTEVIDFKKYNVFWEE